MLLDFFLTAGTLDDFLYILRLSNFEGYDGMERIF